MYSLWHNLGRKYGKRGKGRIDWDRISLRKKTRASKNRASAAVLHQLGWYLENVVLGMSRHQLKSKSFITYVIGMNITVVDT